MRMLMIDEGRMSLNFLHVVFLNHKMFLNCAFIEIGHGSLGDNATFFEYEKMLVKITDKLDFLFNG